MIGIAQLEKAYEPLAQFHAATAAQKRCVELTVEMVAKFQAADFTACLTVEEQLAREIGSSKLGSLYRQLSSEYLIDPPPVGFSGEIILASK